MMKYASLALALALGLTLAGGSASAQLLDANGSLDVNGSTNGTDVGVSSNANTSAGADSASSTDSEEDSSVSGQAGFGSSVSLSIVRDDMDDSTDYTVRSAGSVRTASSLEAYAGATAQADERLESVVVGEGKMELEYRKPAKFLWIFPGSVRTHVAVGSDSDVSVRYPWYSFLMSIDESRSDLEARLQSEIDSINASFEVAGEGTVTTSSGVQGDPEVRRWARIIETVYAAVAGSARVAANAEAAS